MKADPSTLWWQLWAPDFRVVFVGQRLRFLNGGTVTTSADFPSAFWFKGWPTKPAGGP